MTLDVVIAKYDRDVTGMVADAKRYLGADRVLVYDKLNPDNPLTVPKNKGNEASAYLKYILDNYDALPDTVFFCHDEEFSWHHTGSLWRRAGEAMDAEMGFVNVNHFILGDITRNTLYPAILEWYDEYCKPFVSRASVSRAENWTSGRRGCAQFVVAGERISRHPRRFYQGLYDWLMNTELDNATSGRYLEWTWHLFWDDAEA
jgi:hypothetical protein